MQPILIILGLLLVAGILLRYLHSRYLWYIDSGITRMFEPLPSDDSKAEKADTQVEKTKEQISESI